MQFVDAVQNPLEDPNRDIPNQRVINTKYGVQIKLERRDPYGFIYVVWHDGRTPNALSGAYSDFMLARQAVNNYINSNTFNKVVEEAPVIERAQYKKRFRNSEN